MKNFVQFAVTATLAVGAVANSHRHLHRHAKRQGPSKVEESGPDQAVKYVAVAAAVVYQLDGKTVDPEKAAAGLKNGEYVVVGETTPVYSPPPPPPPPKPTTTSSSSSSSSTSSSTSSTSSSSTTSSSTIMLSSSTKSSSSTSSTPTTTSGSKNLGAQFIEKPSTSSSQAPTTSLSTPLPPKSTPAAKPGAHTGGTGLDTEFPNGQIPCSEFPYQYGAVALDWLNIGGWSGLQFVPDFSLATSLSISKIITGVAGDKCSPGCMCSYSCPPGYQKTQWTKAQGVQKQSVGGLHCNSKGYLELTRESATTLCERGAGGVSIQNDLDEVVSACRTDYPGTESMVIPAVAKPGETIPLTNPDQQGFLWDGKATSAQYYLNKKGLQASDCCVWTCAQDPLGCGNWAPVILGVGQAADGITYLSIFQNLPTSTAKLDFNVEITGDVTTKCAFKNGKWIGGDNGCTTGMQKGGKAVIRYF